MKLNDYQNKAMSTCMGSSRNMSYMAMGLVSEVGELTGKIAKAIRNGDVYIGNNDQDSDLHYTIGFMADPDRCREWESDLKHELGDILWFAAGIAEVMGWTLEEVAFDETFDKIAGCQGDAVDRVDFLQAMANDIVELLLIYFARTDGDMVKKQNMKKALLNFKAVKNIDLDAIMDYYKIKL